MKTKKKQRMVKKMWTGNSDNRFKVSIELSFLIREYRKLYSEKNKRICNGSWAESDILLVFFSVMKVIEEFILMSILVHYK